MARKVFCVLTEMVGKVLAFNPSVNPKYIFNGIDQDMFALMGPEPGDLVLGLFGDIKEKKGLELLLANMDWENFKLRKEALHHFLKMTHEERNEMGENAH